MIRYACLVITIILINISQVLGQDQKQINWLKKLEEYKLQPVLAFQMWSTYTIGEEVFDPETQQYQKVDNRMNMQLRRSRIGLRGQPYKNIKFDLTVAIDLVGSDMFAGTYGASNNGASPALRLWNAYAQWRIINDKELLHLTGGYFTPRLGRASITTPWRSTSMEKSWSQNYLRRHLTGIGPGRVNGLNLGGIAVVEKDRFQVNYDLGLFDPLYTATNGNSTGKNFSPLFVGRVAFQIGEPEFQKYTLGHQVNYFGKRKGLSIAIGGAHQGNSDLFKNSQTLSADFLFNWKHTNIDGEWSWGQRTALNQDNGDSQKTDFQTGYLRFSQNFVLNNGYVLEGVLMVMEMRGATNIEEQELASSLKSFSGEDGLLDIGVNLYLNPNLKVGLHYNHQLADDTSAPAGARVNNYFVQFGAGPIHRGNWIGLGLSAIL